MKRSGILLMLHGITGGIIAGAIVALWFLIVDFSTTRALYTPSLLASIILREEFAWPTFRLVLAYTILHFGVFAVLGVGTVSFLRGTGTQPGLLVGAVFGVGVLNAVHYGGLLMTGAELLTVLPVVHVLGANLVGGMVMMAFLHRITHAEGALGLGVLANQPLIRDGLIMGLLGAGAVALWFFLVDLMTNIPFHTPAALGSALLLGASSPADVQFNVGVVLAYSFVHVVAFCAVGLGFAWGAERIRRTPRYWLLGLMGFIVLESLFIATAGILSEWVLGALGWVQIGLGNLIAVGTMGAWLWHSRPEIREWVGREAIATEI